MKSAPPLLILGLHLFSFPPCDKFKLSFLFAPPGPINITTMARQHTRFRPTPSLFTCHQAKLTPQVRSPLTYKQHLLNCTFSQSLTNNQANLLETYNQGIQVQITMKDIKKDDRLCMKSLPQEGGIMQRVFLEIHLPVAGLNLSNNISVPQVRVNIREIERDTSFEIP